MPDYPIIISAIYAGIFALFYTAMSVYVIKVRTEKHIPFGDMNDKDLLTAVRAHGNFAEYVPLFLILLLLLEMNHANPFLMHVLGIGMLIGRALHIYSVLYYEHKHNHPRMRVSGMLFTFLAIFIAAVYNLVWVFELSY